jgi:nitroimidazol reductase NimA-like FMN-containing flavoprotein (pyridoxamine 5'-phosphate oxidase superfamily)
MRRHDREIKERSEIDRIIEQARVCRLGLCRENQPYVVPVSFGYDGTCLYFHSAREGMKIDYLSANNRVCFEVEHEVKVLEDETRACNWAQSFYSAIGFGTVQEIVEPQQKVLALNQIMKHYSGKEWEFDDHTVKTTRLWRVNIESVTGKHR